MQPTNTVDAVGKDGQERAFAKIANKLKVGLEGGVATGCHSSSIRCFFESFKQDSRCKTSRSVNSVK